MQNRHVEIVHRQFVRYQCGCTTTRIEIRRAPGHARAQCAGHHSSVIKDETTTEYRDLCHGEAQTAGIAAGRTIQ